MAVRVCRSLSAQPEQQLRWHEGIGSIQVLGVGGRETRRDSDSCDSPEYST